MNYAIGIIGGAAIGGAGFIIGEKTGYFKSAGPLAGFGQLLYACVAVATGGNLGFTAVALSRGNTLGSVLGSITLIFQASILATPKLS